MAATTTINSAFLQEIKEANEQLWATLQRAENACRARLSPYLKTRCLASLLADLRDQLATHFVLEEAYGYFDDPLEVAPHFSERVQQLRCEHGDLYHEIAQIAEQAEILAARNGHGGTPKSLMRGFLAFHTRLQEHEAHERELILVAHCVDLGVGD